MNLQIEMLLKDIIHRGIETVSVLYPEGEAREMVFAYMKDVFGLKRHMHILDPASRLSDLDSDKALSDFVRMSSGEPLQYVTGKAYFLDNIEKSIKPEHKTRIQNYAQKLDEDTDVVVFGQTVKRDERQLTLAWHLMLNSWKQPVILDCHRKKFSE